LEISFKTKKLERVCIDFASAKKKYSLEMAGKISQRLNELQAANSVENLVQYSVGRCHLLSGDMRGSFAMDLVHPYRLIFEKYETDAGDSCVRITNIKDYH
jgi:proteic killer suppression protein